MNQTPLTPEERQRLDEIFRRLWGNRTGVVGSFGASSYRHHPTFIRRGPLLLEGETAFSYLYVLTPADATVTPKPECPAAHFNCFPEIDGSHVQIHRHEPGPWWGALRAELPKMEAELDESAARRVADAKAEQQRRSEERRAELATAASAWNA